MRISKKSEYALRALVCIAKARPTQLHQIHELSKLENIPVKFLEQILLTLRHAGLLASKRGVKGGYTFARAPGRVTVGEVIRLMDGPLAPVPCASPNPAQACSCPDPATCTLRLLMTEVRHELTTLLDNRTIQEVASMAGDDAQEYVI